MEVEKKEETTKEGKKMTKDNLLTSWLSPQVKTVQDDETLLICAARVRILCPLSLNEYPVELYFTIHSYT